MTTSRAGLVATHMRHSPGASLVVALIVAVLTCGMTVLPHIVSSIREASLSERLDTMPTASRDVVGSTGQLWTAGGGTAPRLPQNLQGIWGKTENALQGFLADAPRALRDVLEEPSYVVTLGDLPPLVDERMFLSMDPLYDSHLTLVEGRLPQLNPAKATLKDGIEYEVIATQATADSFEWKVGESRTGALSTAPITLRGGELAEAPTFTLVGIFEPDDPSSTYWAQLPQLLKPATYYDPYQTPFRTGSFFTTPQLLSRSMDYPQQPVKMWFGVKADKIKESNAAAIAAQLLAFTSKSRTLEADTYGVGAFSFQSKLTDALARVVGTNHALTGIMLMFVAGPCGVGLAVLLLGTRMILQHRRSAFALIDARGASRGQRRFLLGLEGALAGIPAAIVGTAIGVLLVKTVLTTSTAPLLGSLTIALITATALFPALALASAVLGMPTVDRKSDLRGSRVRLFVEGAVIIVAALAAMTLVTRGVGKVEEGIDPLATVTPLILTLAAALITLRLYPWVLRLVQRREHRKNGFVSFVGSARAVREAGSSAAALLALLVGVSIAVSSSVVLSTIDASARQTAETRAGTDLSLSVGRFVPDAAEQVAALDGVHAVIPVMQVPNIAVTVNNRTTRMSLYALDTDAFEKMTVAPGSVIPSGVSLTDTGEVPLIMSTSASKRLGIGTGAIEIGGTQKKVAADVKAIVGDTASFAGVSNWILVDRSRLEELAPSGAMLTSILVDLDEGASAQSVVDAVKNSIEPNVIWATPQSIRAELTSGAATAGLRSVLLGAIGVAALLCAIAVVLTLVLGAPARSRLLALLKTLGASPKSAPGIVAWELVPMCIAAIVSGVLFGLALPLLLLRVIDVRPFSGADTAPPYVVDPLTLAISLGGFILVAVVFTLLSLVFARRVRVSSVLRTVEET